jgi:putative transposase
VFAETGCWVRVRANRHPVPQTAFPHCQHLFDGDALQRLRAIFEKVCTDFDAQLVGMDGEDNHVHLLVNYPPKHSVSSLVNSLKGVSSRLLRQDRPDLEQRYWKRVLWSPSYFAASCAGAPIAIVKTYIAQQRTPE